MNALTIAIAIVVTGSFLWACKFGGRLPGKFRSRSCQGVAWRQEFPQFSKQEIRQFLLLFVSAFAFNDDQKLILNPGDKVIEIYKALYPSKWLADALEIETLAKELYTQYGVHLAECWSEQLTLGELFLFAQQMKAAPK